MNSTKKYSEPINGSKNKLNSKINWFFNLLLFMGFTVLFGTIYGSHCTILVIFYIYLQYFQ